MTLKAVPKGGIAANGLMGRPQPNLPQTSLPQLCDRAADHVARARIALFDDANGSDQALIHLDEAIDCLQRLWEHGKASQSVPPLKAARRRSA